MGRSRNDPQVPAAPLLRFIPPANDRDGFGHYDGGYGPSAWAEDVAAALGVTVRTVGRWVRRMREGGTISLYTADELCSLNDVPWGSVYPVEARSDIGCGAA